MKGWGLGHPEIEYEECKNIGGLVWIQLTMGLGVGDEKGGVLSMA